MYFKKREKMKKLVIAYSGGLDTSYCAVSLSKAGYEVHAVSVNTGGFTSKRNRKTLKLMLIKWVFQPIKILMLLLHFIKK